MNKSPLTSTSTEQARRYVERPATREVIGHRATESFRWIEHDYPSEIARWNFHPEYEIHLIRKGTGTYVIGDQVGPFAPGHVTLIGSGLPHDWMSDLVPDEVIRNRDAVIQFSDGWLNNCLATLPELSEVRELLDSSGRGIEFIGQTAIRAAAAIEAIGLASGAERVACMFTLLGILANSPARQRRFVAQEWFVNLPGSDGSTAVEVGLRYIFENLSENISMSAAAKRARMSEPTFSKYFKKASGLTFTDMVRKLRISDACRQLENTATSVSSIALGVGYSNLANFNRQFLAQMAMTPSAYRRLNTADRPRPQALGLRLSAPV